jgi:ketosteroid isomerase-like protein
MWFGMAFGRGDVPAILAALGEDIDWRVPDNLPHGGDFRGSDAVGRLFQASARTGRASLWTSRTS